MALRGEPSDFTSVLHTGLKHKNKLFEAKQDQHTTKKLQKNGDFGRRTQRV